MCRTFRPRPAAAPIRALLTLLLTLGAARGAGAQASFVMGQVLDEDGTPVAGALVAATRPDSGSERSDTNTDRNGRFAMIGLRPGVWTFLASAPGFGSDTQAVRVTVARVHPPLEFRLRRAIEVPTTLGDLDVEALRAELADARALLAAGRADEALAAYRAVQSRVPALTTVQLYIAQAYRQKGDHDAAIAAYRAVLAGASSERARLELALTQIERGDLEAGLAELRAAAAAPGASREAPYALGEALARAGRSAEAVTAFEQASALDDAWARPHLRLAELAAASGDPAGARAHLERVIALAPGSPEAADAASMLAADRGRR